MDTETKNEIILEELNIMSSSTGITEEKMLDSAQIKEEKADG